MDGRPESRPPSLLGVLSGRQFGPYVLGASVSNLGTWFQNLAQSVLVYRLTGSTFLVGLVNCSMFASLLILVPWSGPMADRYDRRRLLLATQCAACCIALALWFVVAVGAEGTGLVVVFALLMGVATAFSVPALQSLVPALVPANHLSRALSLNAVSFNLARAVGPVLGAAVVVAFGFAWAFFLNAASFLAFVVALLMIRPRGTVSDVVEPRRLRDTALMLRQERRLLGFLVVVALASLTADPINTISPGFATQVYGLQDTFSGWMIGTFGLGAVAGALAVSKKETASVGPAAAMLIVEGAGMFLFGLFKTPALGLICLGVAGFGWLAAVMLATTAIQGQVADEHRGRIMAFWSIAFMGVRPVSSLASGLLASSGGLQVAALIFALPVVVGGVYLLAGQLGRR